MNSVLDRPEEFKILCKKTVTIFEHGLSLFYNNPNSDVLWLNLLNGLYNHIGDFFQKLYGDDNKIFDQHKKYRLEKEEWYNKFLYENIKNYGKTTLALQEAHAKYFECTEKCDMLWDKALKISEKNEVFFYIFQYIRMVNNCDNSLTQQYIALRDAVLVEMICACCREIGRKRFLDKIDNKFKPLIKNANINSFLKSGSFLLSKKSVNAVGINHKLSFNINDIGKQWTKNEVIEIQQWCDENLDHSFYVGECGALFNTEIDAMAFKLRWI